MAFPRTSTRSIQAAKVGTCNKQMCPKLAIWTYLHVYIYRYIHGTCIYISCMWYIYTPHMYVYMYRVWILHVYVYTLIYISIVVNVLYSFIVLHLESYDVGYPVQCMHFQTTNKQPLCFLNHPCTKASCSPSNSISVLCTWSKSAELNKSTLLVHRTLPSAKKTHRTASH